MDSYEDCSVLFLKKIKKETSHISFQEKKFQASSAGLIGMEKLNMCISIVCEGRDERFFFFFQSS